MTGWYCARPHASSDARSAFRCASLGAPSTEAVIRTPSALDGRHLRPAGVVRVARSWRRSSGSVPISPSVEVSVRPPAIVAVDLVDHVRMNGLRSAAASSVVTSRALETCPAWSSPCGFSKCVAVRPSARAFAFIIATKRGIEPWPTYDGERGGGVVRARHERCDREVPHREPLARAEVDGRLADRGRLRRDGDDVVEPGMLERDEHRHQLRDARRRALARRAPARRGRRRPGRRERCRTAPPPAAERRRRRRCRRASAAAARARRPLRITPECRRRLPAGRGPDLGRQARRLAGRRPHASRRRRRGRRRSPSATR